jgi:hypothetical protein
MRTTARENSLTASQDLVFEGVYAGYERMPGLREQGIAGRA